MIPLRQYNVGTVLRALDCVDLVLEWVRFVSSAAFFNGVVMLHRRFEMYTYLGRATRARDEALRLEGFARAIIIIIMHPAITRRARRRRTRFEIKYCGETVRVNQRVPDFTACRLNVILWIGQVTRELFNSSVRRSTGNIKTVGH